MNTDPKHPIVRHRPEHCLSRSNIDPDALKVLYRLNREGFTAYLVGGGVRDLLLGSTPKDFDVGTDATPRQIKRIFRNSMLIGRRFRLAHIRFGDKVIETSTFRRTPDSDADPSDPEACLLMLRDNVYGTPREDACRRDFTINGLFYDISDHSIIDHVGGLDDLDNRIIRSIGDPGVRFREDPVRMLRAVRFAARLGFGIETETWQAIVAHHSEILKASPPRLLEEVYRLFSYRSGEKAFRLLRASGLLSDLFPEIDEYVARSGEEESPLWSYLAALDSGAEESGEPTPLLKLAGLYYPLLRDRVRAAKAAGEDYHYGDLAQQILTAAAERFQMPKTVLFRLILVFSLQQRFSPETTRRFSKAKFVAQECYPDALSIYGLRVSADGKDPELLAPWLELYEDFVEKRDARLQSKTLAPEEVHERAAKSRRKSKKTRRRGKAQRLSAADGPAQTVAPWERWG